MFAIFLDNEFYSLWSNKKEDIWYQLTLSKINTQNKQAECYWYETNNTPEFYGFDENKNLQIKEKVISLDENENEVISYNVIQTINKESGEWL
jgi:hypothetical protein